jgi:hypothetical protein
MPRHPARTRRGCRSTEVQGKELFSVKDVSTAIYRWPMTIEACAELPFPVRRDPTNPDLAPRMVDANAMLSSIDNHYQRAGHPEFPA